MSKVLRSSRHLPKNNLNPLCPKRVHKIPRFCGAVYIGETRCWIKTRMSKRQRCLGTCSKSFIGGRTTMGYGPSNAPC